MIPREAFQAMDEATTRAEGLEKAAPWIIWKSMEFLAGNKVTLFAFFVRKFFAMALMGTLAWMWLNSGGGLRWALGAVVILGVADLAMGFASQYRMARRAIVFSQQKPEYWR